MKAGPSNRIKVMEAKTLHSNLICRDVWSLSVDINGRKKFTHVKWNFSVHNSVLDDLLVGWKSVILDLT